MYREYEMKMNLRREYLKKLQAYNFTVIVRHLQKSFRVGLELTHVLTLYTSIFYWSNGNFAVFGSLTSQEKILCDHKLRYKLRLKSRLKIWVFIKLLHNYSTLQSFKSLLKLQRIYIGNQIRNIGESVSGVWLWRSSLT